MERQNSAAGLEGAELSSCKEDISIHLFGQRGKKLPREVMGSLQREGDPSGLNWIAV